MMYRLIAEALEEQGITNVQPKDYLHFFCLGKREPMTPVRYNCCYSTNSKQFAAGTYTLHSLRLMAGFRSASHALTSILVSTTVQCSCQLFNTA